MQTSRSKYLLLSMDLGRGFLIPLELGEMGFSLLNLHEKEMRISCMILAELGLGQGYCLLMTRDQIIIFCVTASSSWTLLEPLAPYVNPANFLSHQ